MWNMIRRKIGKCNAKRMKGEQREGDTRKLRKIRN